MAGIDGYGVIHECLPYPRIGRHGYGGHGYGVMDMAAEVKLQVDTHTGIEGSSGYPYG